MNDTVLIVGAGGREHALAWTLARSPQVGQVIVSPGNAGTIWESAEGIAACENAPYDGLDFENLISPFNFNFE